jgi:ABC-2 type transport system permease protein
MYVLWRVIVKELLQIRRDRRMIPVIFVSPVVMIVVFGFAVNTDVTNVPMVLVDQDRSVASRDLVTRFVRSGYFDVVAAEERAEDVDRWLVTSRAQLGLVIGAGFGDALASGGTAALQVIADGSDAASASVALGYAGALAQGFGAEVQAARLRAAGEAPRHRPGQVELEPRVFYNPDLKSRWFYVPAVLAMVLMVMTMLLSAMGVVREKEVGTMEQLIVTPIRPWQLLVGKLAPFALIGVVQVFLITAVAVFGFRVPLRGSFPLLLGLTLLFLLVTLGVGLLV